MGWFDDQGINYPGGSPTFDERTGQYRSAPADVHTAAAAPQAGQFAPTNQGFLDWATQQYGADPTRGSGFVNAAAGGGLENMLRAYTAATGNRADFEGGPSGDRGNFGQGTEDVLTSGGLVWNAAGGGGGGAPGGGGGGMPGGGGPWPMPTGPLPTAPDVVPLGTPAPFHSTVPQLGTFQGPAAAAAPERLTYTPGQTPTAFVGSRQATPGVYAHENYTGPTAADLAADPGYQFRLKAGQEALENSAASRGMLRGGNTAKALIDYGQGAASQEYAAVDARRRATNAANNAGQLGAFQTNLTAAERANADNYARAAAEAQQGFANENLVGQQTNAGRMAATSGNNAAAQAAQAQRYAQEANSYGLNLGAQAQNYGQQLGTYQTNTEIPLAYTQNTNASNLANYAARVNAGLGYGNLALGEQTAANTFGIQQGQLGLQRAGQAFDQNLATYNRNYQTAVADPWARSYQLAALGNPGAPNGQANASAQSDLWTQQGNVGAAGIIGAQNATGQGWQTGITAGAQLGTQLLNHPEWPTVDAPYPGYGVWGS